MSIGAEGASDVGAGLAETMGTVVDCRGGGKPVG